MQTLRKKTSPCKYRNDPGRFFGDGVTFKAKLIGILEVGEARGDRMCQEALQDLKIAIRAAGEHKQRITIHVTIDGLRLRDEKTSDSLYHHPVHKISFIAQDMSDSRAFGYIFGSPDSGHRFFGIKTDKAASQVVLAMRDLFQVVFELKKKEIELARQHIQSKTIHEHQPITSSLSVKSGGSNVDSTSPTYASKTHTEPSTSSKLTSQNKDIMSPESVADLVDLEQELSSIQRGITQMEQITPNEPTAKIATGEEDPCDPFGDSFTKFPTYNLLPPPESSKSRHSKPLKPPDQPKPSAPPSSQVFPSSNTTNTSSNTIMTKPNDWATTKRSAAPFEEPKLPVTSVFENESTMENSNTKDNPSPPISGDASAIITSTTTTTVQYIDAFTDLDPLGTGKIKPYIDKKYFFQDLKNPPKKVLRDMSEQESIFSANFSPASGTQIEPNDEDLSMFEGTTDIIRKDFANEIDFKANFSATTSSSAVTTQTTSTSQSTTMIHTVDKIPSSGQDLSTTTPLSLSHKILKTEDPIIGNNKALLVTDNDPFSPRMKKFDPFDDDNFSKSPLDPFEFSFATGGGKSTIIPDTKITSSDDTSMPAKIHIDKKITEFNGPLQVNLPPESYSAYMSGQQKRIERHNSDASDSGSGISRIRPSVFKQNTVDTVMSSISTKKMKPHLFSQKYSKRDSNSINMRRLQESDSLSENETAPEPPPRPDSSSHIEPPPLPPKKQFSDIVIRPRVTSPLATIRDSSISSTVSIGRYDYVGSGSANNKNAGDATSPAIPLPSRKVSRTDSAFPGPMRPAKKGGLTEDDYLTPISSSGNKTDMPILLPPPQTKGTLKNRGRRQGQPEPISVQTKTVTSDVCKDNDIISIPDLTLSQLLTLGIDELAAKLKVSVSKLSTMNIVELTQYLCDFIERSSQTSANAQQQQPTSEPTPQEAIFKVSFDESNDATFIAKFDDSFGEDDHSFVPDFDRFNTQPEATVNPATAKTSADRYAVFREIIEQDLKSDDDHPNDGTSDGAEEPPNSDNDSNLNVDDNEANAISSDGLQSPAPPTVTKIDTKITQAIANAKDRYAALRDIILVEDLFEKPNVTSSNGDLLLNDNDDDELSMKSSINKTKIEISDSFGVTVATNDDTTNDSDNAKYIDDDTQSSPEINISMMINNESMITNQRPVSCDKIELITTGTSITAVPNTKDDLEIDEYMNRAISNLSLDSRDHLSPISSKSPIASTTISKLQNASTSPIRLQMHNNNNKLPATVSTEDVSIDQSQLLQKKSSNSTSLLNDMSTSPIPLTNEKISPSRSPIPLISRISKSPQLMVDGGMGKNLSQNRLNSGSMSDVVCGSSPEVDKNVSLQQSPVAAVAATTNNESWATFEPQSTEVSAKNIYSMRSPKDDHPKEIAESPCSSDDKNDWKPNRDGHSGGGIGGNTGDTNKRWARGQTSSSSRDVSPWDDDVPEYYKRRIPPPPPANNRHGYYMRHGRRMTSGDDDYDYEDDRAVASGSIGRDGKRRGDKRSSSSIGRGDGKSTTITRSRETFDNDSQTWYHSPGNHHHSWSPADDDDIDPDDHRSRAFDRNAYERSTYGPPYEKRGEPTTLPIYDRKDYKSYDKRKYYQNYVRPSYEFEGYGEIGGNVGGYKDKKISYYDDYEQRVKGRKEYDDDLFESPASSFSRDARSHKSAKEYFYDRSGGGGGSGEKRSFDRESMDSYDSGRRKKSFGGSGDMYASLGSQEEFRERYVPVDKMRSTFRGSGKGVMKQQRSHEEYEQDSEGDVMVHRGPGDTRSLQRPSGSAGPARPRKSSGSSPWDGEDLTPTSSQKSWKRPASASESDRKLSENRRVLTHTLPGSDGEKDRRFRKKIRSRGKEVDCRSNYAATMRHLPMHRGNSSGGIDLTYEDYADSYRSSSRRKNDPINRQMTQQDRRHHNSDTFEFDRNIDSMHKFSKSNRDVYYDKDNDDDDDDDDDDAYDHHTQPPPSSSSTLHHGPKSGHRRGTDYSCYNDYDDEQTSVPPRSAIGGANNKFNFDDEQGFESDFNSPSSNGKARFSNDFSEKESSTVRPRMSQNLTMSINSSSGGGASSSNQQDPKTLSTPTPPTSATLQKLRFDDKITISKFDSDRQIDKGKSGGDGNSDMFDDDDFSKAEFSFENEDQWMVQMPKKNLKSIRHTTDNIKKSESVNIFAKKRDDPFEDDDFFNEKTSSTSPLPERNNNSSHNNNHRNGNNGGGGNGDVNNATSSSGQHFKWEKNFAKFEDNI